MVDADEPEHAPDRWTSVVCPHCHARQGERCQTPTGIPDRTHLGRRLRAEQWAEIQRGARDVAEAIDALISDFATTNRTTSREDIRVALERLAAAIRKR